MSPYTPFASRLLSWVSILPLITGMLVNALGISALAGWLTGATAWIQVLPSLVPMQGNTAVSFLFSGMALVGLYFGWYRLSAVLGTCVAVFAALTLSQYLLDIDLGIDQLLFEHPVTIHTSHPGRMAPNTAVALMASGLALVLLQYLPFLAALLGSLALTLGAVALLGYATGISGTFAWGDLTHMAVLTALGFTMLGMGLLIFAFARQRPIGQPSTYWIPFLAGATVAIASILFWHALRSQEIDQTQRLVEAAARGVRSEIVHTIDSMTAALVHLAEYGTAMGWQSPEAWGPYAQFTVRAFPDFDMIEWIDASFQSRVIASRRSTPLQLVSSPEAIALQQEALRFARLTQRPTVVGPSVAVGPFFLADGRTALRVLVPLSIPDHSEVYLSGVSLVEDRFAALSESVAPGYHITVLCWDREVFRHGDIQTAASDPWAQTLSLDLPGGLPWQVIVAPQTELLAVQRTTLPEVVLGAGLLIAMLLGLTIRLGERAALRAGYLEAAVRERTAELELENTERRRSEQALQQKTEQLVEADRHKNVFLALLGHELRNPLGSIRNALEVLDLHSADKAVDARMRQIIKRQAGHLARLVDDLLDVSRIERGKLVMRRERLDLVQLIGETLESERAAIQTAGLALEVELPQEPLGVDVDPTRLAQVMGNLLSNARKFTPAGGKVSVHVRTEDESNHAAVTVRDTGCGIDPKDLSTLFDPFIRSDIFTHQVTGGLNLGLLITKGLVEAHGGWIEVFSEGPGRGAEFTFHLPLQTLPPLEKDTLSRDADRSVPQRILVIDDQHDSADALGELLTLEGHQVEVVYDGPSALQAARRFHPDVVICDIGLPGMDGYYVAQELRRDPQTASIRLFALTGYGSEEAGRLAREAGFDQRLTKPVDLAKLRTLLSTAESPAETSLSTAVK